MSSAPELPSGTVTFLFTDIEGSTRLVRLLGERYHDVLAAHQRLLRAAFGEHGGREIDTQGDSFFVAFRRARDAVNAAVAAQRALAAHDWPEGANVKVRMGIHTGEPAVGEERYTGLGVHRAARISTIGHGGQVLLSNATRELVGDDLPPGVALRDLGRHRLKDIDRPERIYQVAADGLPRSFPPLKTAGTVGRARRAGRKGALVAALAAAAVIAAAVVLLTRGGSESAHASSVAPNTVGVVDPESGTIAAQVPVGSAPNGVAAGNGAVWVANSDAASVSRVDPATRSVRQEIDVGGGPSGVAVGGGAVWVANGLDGTVSRIDPTANKVVATIPVGAGPSAVAWGEGAVWVANSIDGTLSRIDPTTWRVTRTLPAAADASAIAIGFDRIWVASQSTGTVAVLDPRSGEVEDRIGVGVDPDAVAAGAGAVWVANRADGTVQKIEPRLRTVIKTIPVGRGPAAIEVTPHAVWVANAGDGTLFRIDPARGAVVSTVALGNPPRGLALSPDGLYVAVRSTGSVHRGGTLRATTLFVSETMDPAVSYNWAVLSSTNDGLVGFRRVGGVQGVQIVPDLAESLAIPTGNGTTYTFVLRRGLRYSTGRSVQPADFRRALERVLRLHSPGASYYGAIVGAKECLSVPKTCDLSRGIVTDPASRTVTFHLTRPDGEFQTKLALPFASAVPSDTPFRDVGARPVPATGPYRISRWVKNKLVTLVRNPAFREWSPDAQPQGYPDVISVRAELVTGKRVRAVERGSADVAGGLAIELTKERLADLASRYPGRLRATTSPETDFMFMNTREPPFDDVRVRRALNLAIDREQLVHRLGEYAHAATCQVLPPNFRAYKPTCLYDRGGLDEARRLVARSGRQGQRVVVWVPPPVAAVETGRYVVSLLRQLGFRTSLKVFGGPPTAYFATVGDSRRRIQIGLSGWAADYPSPAGFLSPLFTCAGFVPANGRRNSNYAEFCDREVERRLKDALALQAVNPPAATLAWQAAERAILQRAPIVPLENMRNVDLVSRRLGNYQYNPEFGFLLTQAWVK
jgi:YVTN family beta-propeller protein